MGSDGGIRVLHVDESRSRDLLADHLERDHERFEVVRAANVGAGLDRVEAGDVDCVVSGYDLPGETDGLEFLAAVRRDHPDLPFVLFTADVSGEIADEAVDRGVTDYRLKGADGERLELLASRIRDAVEAGSTAASEERQADLPESDRRIKRLHAVSTTLESCTTAADIYDAAIEAAVDLLDFSWCAILIEADGQFELAAVSEETPVEAGTRVFPTDHGGAGEVYRTGESIVVSDIHELEHSEPAHEAFRSGVAAPIGDVGVFQGVSDEEDAFDQHDLELAELLVTHLNEALKRVERESELRRQNERLENFARVVSHDLRNPLSVAKGYAELLDARDDEHVELIRDELDRMDAIIDDVLVLARRGETVDGTEPVDLAAAAGEAWRHVDAPAATLETPATGTVAADRNHLLSVFENLFRNALEHGREDVTVTVGDLADGFYVADDGPGIPAADRETVFDHGYTGEESGTGFGLGIVSEIVDAHGWSIGVTESENGGARFEIRTDGT